MIYTVTGKVAKTDFGNACAHEHICVVSNDMKHTFGKNWLDEEKLINLAAKVLKGAGFGLFVDGTPCDLGRDVNILKRVSEQSGVKIVASTGFYYYPNLFSSGRTDKELAKWILKECTKGMEGTGIKPGILKCASQGAEIFEDAKKRLSAVAMVQAETGLPMYVHSSLSGEVEEKIKILLASGAAPQKIIIGHCGLKPDVDYLESILNMGCYISMDQNHCSGRKAEIPKALTELCQKGYANQICLSSDGCIYNDFAGDENTGIEKTPEEHIKLLNYQQNNIYPHFGGSHEDWNKMMGQNIVDILDV